MTPNKNIMQLPSLRDVTIEGKTVFLREDLNVPLLNGKIEDDTRMFSAIPTIEYLLKHDAKIILASHLGRPKGIDKSLSMEPVAKWFGNKFSISNLQFSKRGEFEGWEIGPNIFLLENLRFDEGEEKNDPLYAKKLASLADIYVNDAFASCHRSHASVVGITQFLPHFAGLYLQKEVENLTAAMENPKRPLVVIIGGKKIETKLPLVEKMHGIADYVLVGGKIAEDPQAFLDVQKKKINSKQKSVLTVADLTPDKLSITEKSLYKFLEIIPKAKTIIWNGAMGFIAEKEDGFQATRRIAEAIIESKAYSIVGGGDTLEFLSRIGMLDKFSFVSTGGGAMLCFLSGDKLPGIEALL